MSKYLFVHTFQRKVIQPACKSGLTCEDAYRNALFTHTRTHTDRLEPSLRMDQQLRWYHPPTIFPLVCCRMLKCVKCFAVCCCMFAIVPHPPPLTHCVCLFARDREKESGSAHEYVMSHGWISHISHAQAWVLSQIWMSHVTHENESCHAYEIIRMSPGNHMNDLCCAYLGTWMTPLSFYARHDSFICVTWLIYMCDMTHSYTWYDDSFLCVTWLIHMCDMTHPCVSRDVSYTRHTAFVYVA